MEVAEESQLIPGSESNSRWELLEKIWSTPTDLIDSLEPVKGNQEVVSALATLNNEYDQVYSKLLTQWLNEKGLSSSWLSVIKEVSQKVSQTVKPNCHNDLEEMDIRKYVKIKTIPNGNKSDSKIINGLVFTKNVTNQKMRQKIPNPRILLLSCPVVYQLADDKLTSLDTLLLEETEYIRNLVDRICSFKPDVVLVEKTVARIAQDMLLENCITLVCNVKSSILEKIARFTGSLIIQNLDEQIEPRLGTCQKFYIQSYNQSKTLMFFDGCPPDLGCTIILRGAQVFELKVIKTLSSFMIFSDYNWKLERAFLMDEFAVPSQDKTLETKANFETKVDLLNVKMNNLLVTLEDKKSNSMVIDDYSDPLRSMAASNNLYEFNSPTDKVFVDEAICLNKNLELKEKMSQLLSIVQLSCSPLVFFPMPYLLTSDGINCALAKYFQNDLLCSKRFDSIGKLKNEEMMKVECSSGYHKSEVLSPTEPISIDRHLFLTSDLKLPASSSEIKALVADFRARGPFITKNISINCLKKPEILQNFDEKHQKNLDFNDALNPLNHQRLPVLFSSFSYTSSNAPNYCVRPWIVNMDFYNCNDIPLGLFLERYCFRASYSCPNLNCSTPMIEHVRRFAHNNGSVLIVLRKLQHIVEAAQSSIITWSWCQKCKTGTPYSSLSDESWSLSFAKYLELKFYGTDYCRRQTSSSVACMEHSLHQDHFQFFASKQTVASFKYSPIVLYEIDYRSESSEPFLLPVKEKLSYVVKENDAGSIIACTLSSSDYEKIMSDSCRLMPSPNLKRKSTASNDFDKETQLESSLNGKSTNQLTQPHIELQFSDNNAKFSCCVYYPEHFRRFRAKLFDEPNGEELYIHSLSNCVPWTPRGGKSKATFFKTSNDRFILKEMSKPEIQSFINIASYYFDYYTKAIEEAKPTLLVKIFGVYKTNYKNNANSTSTTYYLLVMENLFYNRNIIQKFDLKGSTRNRLFDTKSPGIELDQIVLLDENLLKMTCDSPMYIRAHSKSILRAAIDNDSYFLSSHSVMDYSLLVGIDEHNKKFVVGIIDYIRPFTWDKKVEMVIKTGFSTQGKLPTIVQPDVYRIRFCEAMDQYFLCVPDKWFTLANYN